MKLGDLNYFVSSGTPNGSDTTTRRRNRKKKSPATMRRSRRRRDKYIKRKQEVAATSDNNSTLNFTFKDLPPGNIPQVEGNITVENITEEGKDFEAKTEVDNPSVCLFPLLKQPPPINVQFTCEHCFGKFGSEKRLKEHGKTFCNPPLEIRTSRHRYLNILNT